MPLTSCATTARPVAPVEDGFLQAFEAIQMPDKGPGWELMLVHRDAEGKSKVFSSGAEGMDRLVHVWGEAGPPVPLFFSPRGAMRFTMVQAGILTESPSLSDAAIDHLAWERFREWAEKRRSEGQGKE